MASLGPPLIHQFCGFIRAVVQQADLPENLKKVFAEAWAKLMKTKSILEGKGCLTIRYTAMEEGIASSLHSRTPRRPAA